MDMREKSLAVHKKLCAQYQCPIPYFHNLDPLSELISSLLSHRTKNRDSGTAFKSLRRRFPTWEEVRDAKVGDIEEAIQAATWPEQKAPRIKLVLQTITERCDGLLSLDFLAEMPALDARHWLESLHGVGPKTSAAVLLFSRLRIPSLPVDCHHQRVAERLGLIKPRLGSARMHDILAKQLPDDFSAQEVYDNHEVLMLHGQRCCFVRQPACERCVVLDLCPYGQQRMSQGLLGESARSTDSLEPGNFH
jgi:endonuclease-3